MKKLHEKCIFYLDSIEVVKIRIKDLEFRYNLEKNKPKIESFLHAPPSWYENQIQHNNDFIVWMNKRYNRILLKIKVQNPI